VWQRRRRPAPPDSVVAVPDVDASSFLVIVAVAAVASLIVAALPWRPSVPVVVVELVLGILVGPQVLALAEVDATTEFFSNLGLGMLFFFAGYEIDMQRIRGRPIELAALGWLLSVVLAFGIGGALAVAGVVLSFLFTGSALATTALGTLIPILRDAGELRTRFGPFVLGAGTIGELGPILLLTLVLSTKHPLHEALLLLAFVGLAVATGLIAVRSAGRGWPLLERTLETSGQLGVRIVVVLVFGLVALAASLRLDVLLGGLLAGLILRSALRGREVEVLESKLTAVGYGFFIPFFFVLSGMRLDVDALVGSADTLARVPLFLVLFMVVRGAPALLLYRGVLGARDRVALACFSATQLPMVVAITTLAVDGGHMRAATAAALVGAAILSTLVFPLVGLRLRSTASAAPAGGTASPGTGPTADPEAGRAGP
jgi:Kef-type K+ transport system membrane component KefB